MGIDLAIADATQEPCHAGPVKSFGGGARMKAEELPFRASAKLCLQFGQEMLAIEPIQPEPEGLAADKLDVLRVQAGDIPSLGPGNPGLDDGNPRIDSRA